MTLRADACHLQLSALAALDRCGACRQLARDHRAWVGHPREDDTTPRPPFLDLVAFLERGRKWSERTFGPGYATERVVAHLREDGFTPAEIALALARKQEENERREWPDWREADPTKPMHHVRAEDDLAESGAVE